MAYNKPGSFESTMMGLADIYTSVLFPQMPLPVEEDYWEKAGGFGQKLHKTTAATRPIGQMGQNAAMSMIGGMPTDDGNTGTISPDDFRMMREMGGEAGALPYEAEGGEIVEQGNEQMPVAMENGTTQQVGPGAQKVVGPQHEQGGVDMSGGEYVFSDTLKTESGLTFAREAEKLYKELDKLTKLYSKNNDRFLRSGYKRMASKIDKKLGNLREEQEANRTEQPQISGGMEMKTGGWIKGHSYNISEEEISKLEKIGFKIERI